MGAHPRNHQESCRKERAERNGLRVDSKFGGSCGMERTGLSVKEPQRSEGRGRRESQPDALKPKTHTRSERQTDIAKPQGFHIRIEPSPAQRQHQPIFSQTSAPRPMDATWQNRPHKVAHRTKRDPGAKMDGIKEAGRQQSILQGTHQSIKTELGIGKTDNRPKSTESRRHHQPVGNLEMLPIDQGNRHGQKRENGPRDRLTGICPMPLRVGVCPSRSQQGAEGLHQDVESRNGPRAPCAFATL